jgi:glycosyltransferase involved in cell wall biosynthesis
MRVLVVHNRYRSALPSGENRVVDLEVATMAEAGVEVETYFQESDDIASFGPIAKAAMAVRPTYSFADTTAVRRLIRRFRPDVVHLHNPYPMISPAVVRVAKAEGVPVIQTVHNVRHACVAGSFFRDGAVCEDCRGRTLPIPAIMHGCYQGSRVNTLPMAVAATLHRSTWQHVDRFLPISEFVGSVLRSVGIPDERITVKANGIVDPGPPAPIGDGYLFFGRLDPEKGLGLLLDAWSAAELPNQRLTIAGDGPLRAEVEAAARANPTIDYVGLLDRDGVQQALRQSAVVVVPSLWYEGLSITALEALAAGRPVLSTWMGSLAELIDGVGWVVEPKPTAFADGLRASVDGDARASFGAAARDRYCANFERDHVMRTLLAIYGEVAAPS